MSNPFDQFSSDLSSALPQPPSPYGAPSMMQPPPSANPYGMAPPMGGETNMYSGVGGYGAPPPPAAPPAPPMNDSYSNSYGAPSTQSYGNNAPDAASVYNDPWGSSNGMGGAPPMPPPAPMAEPTFSQSTMSPNPYGAAAVASPNPYSTATPVTPNPYGMPVSDSSAYGAPPPPPQEPSYGAPPSLPTMGHTNAYGGAPTSPPNQYGGMPPTPDQSHAYGAAPMSEPNPYGMPPPPQPAMEQNPYGAAPVSNVNPYGGAPPAPFGDVNPYGAPPAPPDMNNPYGAPPAPPDTNNPYGAPPAPPDMNNPYGAPPAPPDMNNPYGTSQYPPPPPADQNPYGAAPPSEPNPYGASPPPNPYAVPMEPPNPYGAPYGLPPSQPNPYGAPIDSSMMALVPAQQQSNPYALSAMGYGQPPPQYGYGAPPPPPPIDPFSVFETQKSPAPAPAAPLAIEAVAPPTHMVDPMASDDDFWGSFGPPSAQAAAATAAAKDPNEVEQPIEVPERRVEEEKKSGDDALPPGGEWYDARIFTPTLGVMFFKPQELTDSLYLNTDKEIIEGLGDRPVVAFIVEGSSARSASVELGHVLLKVNGISVKNPKEASRLIKEGPRPLPLVFYIPKTDVVISEGEHMVKYDSKETVAPNSAKDWKPKYVVIGGIIAQPWMMNMYRSKSEYDIAVIETQARRPVSVKVKQFSLQGARIQNDWQGPQIVKYKNKLHPWKFICVLPVAGNPIKISSPNLSQLKPVHEGIRRVLLAQQRVSGGRHGSQRTMQSDPAHDDRYRNENRGNDSQYDNRRNHDGHDRPGYAPQQQQAYGY